MTLNQFTDEQLTNILTRYEGAINETESVGDTSDEAMKELTDARADVLTVLKEARQHMNSQANAIREEGTRWESVSGRALKVWATALMTRLGITRDAAREVILVHITAATAEQKPVSQTMCSADIGKVPAILDHLPEGSH